jgi:branched-chain amino acid transport system substrate-binding protein
MMMLRRKLVWVMGMSLLAAACGGGEGGGEVGDDGMVVVPIGYVGPLSGGAAYYGRNVERGLEMAAAEIEEAGGFMVNGQPHRFELVTADDRYLPYETTTAVRRLLQQDHPAVIFVPHAGGIRAVQEMNLNEPRFLLMAYSSEPSILEAHNPLQIMLPPRFDGYQKPFSEVLMARFGKRLALVPTTTAYGRAWTEAVTAEWQRQGGTVGRDNGVDYNTTTDFSGAVSRALADNPDVLFVGMDQAKMEEMLQIVPMSDLEGSVGVYPQEQYPTPGTPGWAARYHARYGADEPPATSEIGINYQALHLVADAMSIAGTTTDPDAIRAAFSQAAASIPDNMRVLDLSGVDESGQLGRVVIAAQVLNGEFVPVPIPAVTGNGM